MSVISDEEKRIRAKKAADYAELYKQAKGE